MGADFALATGLSPHFMRGHSRRMNIDAARCRPQVEIHGPIKNGPPLTVPLRLPPFGNRSQRQAQWGILPHLDGMPIPEDTIAALRFILRVFALDNLTAVRLSRRGGVWRSSLVYLGKPSRLVLSAAIPRVVAKHTDKAALFEGMTKSVNGFFSRALSRDI